MSTPVPNNHRKIDSHGWLLPGVTVLLFAAMFLLLLGLNMRRELNHDEHQFIAGAALIGREGMLPYRDFAYFHVPLQSYIYALLFRFFDSLLLSSRLFSVLFGWLSLVLLFGHAWARHTPAHDSSSEEERSAGWARWRFAALASLWMLALPLFTYTSGRAWNHDLPVFLLLLATVIHINLLEQARAPAWFALTGLLMGLATATRLSFALVTIPFVLVLWLTPMRRRLLDSAAFIIGSLLGLGLLLYFLVVDHQAFFFGNVEYVRLNTEYYRTQGTTDAMSLAGKLSYFGGLLSTAPVGLTTLMALVIGLWPLRHRVLRRSSSHTLSKEHPPVVAQTERARLRLRLGFLLLLLLFALIGALGATPSQPQYFYPLFPLALLALVDSFASWPARLQPGGQYAYALGALTAILVAGTIYAPGLIMFLQPGEWFPAKTRSYGRLIGDLVEDGRVLTLAPLYALEGKAAIYPEFATGPFAWRISPLVNEAKRQQFHVAGPDDLAALLASDPPRAILTGVENDDADEEALFLAYASENHYVPATLPDESTLWLAPQANWGHAVQLGSVLLPRRIVQPGESLLLNLYLQSLRQMTTNYNVLVRIANADGEELLRDDGWPFGSPTSQWPTGEVWVDGHLFSVPDRAAPGYYRIDVSFYDPSTLDDLGAPATVGYLLVGDAHRHDTRSFRREYHDRNPAMPPLAETDQGFLPGFTRSFRREYHDRNPAMPPLAETDQGFLPGFTRSDTEASLAVFNDTVVLQSATTLLASPSDQARLSSDLVWRTLEPLHSDYTIFVQVLDDTGHLIAQSDAPPLDGFLPTSAWSPLLPIRDRVDVLLPASLAPGEYSVIVGLYDSTTLARLPVSVKGAESEDAVKIGGFRIK